MAKPGQIAVPRYSPHRMATSARQCKFCGCAIYGRSDKRYCTSTCRRDASRVRKRTIRFGEFEFIGSEWHQPDSIEKVLIPQLERQHGANHRLVRDARRAAEELREAQLEEIALTMERLSWSYDD